jgi:hypothetical protein
MTFDLKRIYYNAVFGALGGLISWALVGLLLRPGTGSFWVLLAQDALRGAIVGVCIGAAIGAVDGLTSFALKKALRGILTGGIIGLGSGFAGLVMGEIIFELAGGGTWPRAVGWALFGLLVGTSEGIADNAPGKISYGAVGGLLGGLIGGATYERLSLILRALTHNRSLSLTVGGAVGLIILGACIGALIGLVEGILRRAWVKIMYGPLEGRSLTLAKEVNVLGKDDDCDIVLPGDPDVQYHHAAIVQQEGNFVLVARDATPYLNKRAVTRQPLQSGDMIALGRTYMIFQAEGADTDFGHG